MAASYPSSAKSFTPIVDGVNYPQATDINQAYDEITALEQELVTNGLTNLLKVNAGIKFPATQAASSDVNVLDDYEEGTWTPVIGGTGGTSGQTYVTQQGHYVKIGKLVIAQCYALLSAKGTITGNVQITGLPFTSENTGNYAVTALNWQSLATNWVNLIARVSPAGTVATVQGLTAAGVSNETALTTADIGNNTGLLGTFVYRATA